MREIFKSLDELEPICPCGATGSRTINPDLSITLVTPSYNQAEFLEEAIRSVLEQRYPALEYIVMDGGSTDRSVDIIRKYASQIAHWQSGRDGGQAAAINGGFRNATGEILGWLNSDDILLPGALARVAEFWRRQSVCDFVSGDGEYVSTDGRTSQYYVRAGSYRFADLIRFCKDRYLPQPSVFFSRKAFFEVGGLDESLAYGLDLDLWLKLSRRYQLRYIPEKLSLLRVHEKSKTILESAPFVKEVERVILKHLPHLPAWQRPFVREGVRRWRRRRLQKGFRR